MTDEIPTLTSINTQMNPRATEIRLVLGDSSGRATTLRVEPMQILEIAAALDRMAIDAGAATVLGRQSILSKDQKGHAPSTRSVVAVVPVEVERAGLMADIQQSDGQILRLVFSLEATEAMRSLFSHQHEIPRQTN